MSLTLDTTEDTTVLIDGETVLAGEAARRLRERWGSRHVYIDVTPGAVTIRNMQGPEEMALPVVPPHTMTSAARGNAARRAAIARHAKEVRR